MILQKEFEACGYQDILKDGAAAQYGIDPEDLFDLDDIPAELLGIYISDLRDDLFFLLDGDAMSIHELTKQWDDRVRVFTLINGKKEAIRRLKYNIVQLIVCSGEILDKRREADLYITRKIIIKGDPADKKHIVIDDDEAIDLPFHMIPPGAFAPNAEKLGQLNQLMPEDHDLLALMKGTHRREQRRTGLKVQKKSFGEPDYKKIKGWLER